MTAPDSRELFDDKEVARSQEYLTHLNQYHVINLDITGFISDAVRMDILKDGNGNRKWVELLGRSEKLLEDTIAGDAQAVEKAIEEIRDTQYAPTYYNDEQALRCERTELPGSIKGLWRRNRAGGNCL